MRYLRLLVLVLFTMLAFMSFQAFATKEDAAKTKKACTYCHIKGNPKTLTDAGKYYKEHDKSLEGYKEPEKKKDQ